MLHPPIGHFYEVSNDVIACRVDEYQCYEKMAEAHDFHFMVTLSGDCGVGKTTIVQWFEEDALYSTSRTQVLVRPSVVPVFAVNCIMSA